MARQSWLILCGLVYVVQSAVAADSVPPEAVEAVETAITTGEEAAAEAAARSAAAEAAAKGAAETSAAKPATVAPAPRTSEDVGTVHPTLLRTDEGPFHDADRPVELGTPIQEVRHPSVIPDVFDVALKNKVLPLYPNELQVLYGEQAIRCAGKAWIDASGRPLRVSLIECPDGFQMSALNAMQHWRWEAPTFPVPQGGLPVAVRTGFARSDRRFYPGVTYFAHPMEVTADVSRPVILHGGKMPRYPKQVNAGDGSCLIELVVDARGNTLDPVVDECAPPFRHQLFKVIRSWKWDWTRPPEKGETVTLVTELLFKL